MKLKKFLLEMGPLVIFLVLLFNYDLMAATISMMITTPISMAIYWTIFRKVAVMPVVALVLIMIFGGLTLYFDDTYFFKIKPTVIYCLFGFGLLGALAFGRSLIKTVLDAEIEMTDRGWFLMSLHWGLFFLFMAALNEYVWRNYSDEAWGTFKVVGGISLTLIFSILQLIFIRHHIIEPKTDEEAPPPS